MSLLDEAVALVRSLGTCRRCEGTGRYCASCGGGKFCSCDRCGTYTPVTCGACEGGLTREAHALVARADKATRETPAPGQVVDVVEVVWVCKDANGRPQEEVLDLFWTEPTARQSIDLERSVRGRGCYTDDGWEDYGTTRQAVVVATEKGLAVLHSSARARGPRYVTVWADATAARKDRVRRAALAKLSPEERQALGAAQ